jgi:hypothetical protein
MKKAIAFDTKAADRVTEFHEDLTVSGEAFTIPKFRLAARLVPETGEKVIHLILPPSIERAVVQELRRVPPKFARLYMDHNGRTSMTLMFDDGTETPFALSCNADSWLTFIPKEIRASEPVDGVRLVVNVKSGVAMILYCFLGGDGSETLIVPSNIDARKPIVTTGIGKASFDLNVRH